MKRLHALCERKKLSSIKLKNFLDYFIIIVLIFILDRISKIYLLNLHENGIDVDYYVFPFLNIYLAWNTGIGFGLFPSDANIFYHFLTGIIGIINLLLMILLFKLDNIRKYFISMILGGSLGNFFDRIYYFAVPDFVDLHIGNFHWFIFNIADIFITIGIVFCLIGAFGILKLPDVYTRMHSAGIIDTLGIGFIFIGLLFQAGFTLISAKLILILIFVFFSSPTSTHALARSALNGGQIPVVKANNIPLPIDKYEESN